jgi:hypothetical protein
LFWKRRKRLPESSEGVPAKPVRNLDDSNLAAIKHAAGAYVEVVKLYREKT